MSKNIARRCLMMVSASAPFAMRMANGSEGFEDIDGSLVTHVAGVERGGRLKQHDLDFALRRRPVFDSARHNQEFAFAQFDAALGSGFLAVIHAERAAN